MHDGCSWHFMYILECGLHLVTMSFVGFCVVGCGVGFMGACQMGLVVIKRCFI